MSPRTTPPPLPKIMPQRASAEVGATVAPQHLAAGASPAQTSRSIVRRALLGLAAMIVVALGSAWLLDASIEQGDGAVAVSADGRGKLATVKSWGYQLQRLDVGRAASSGLDLIVIDGGLDEMPASGEARVKVLQRLKQKPDGNARLVMAYLSIGEAENYRPYWRSTWTTASTKAVASGRLGGLTTVGAVPARAHVRVAMGQADAPLLSPSAAAPAWLGAENAEWRGNFSVRYWHPDWKSLVLGQPEAALDRIIEAGFDGVYLDRADVYSLWRHEQPSAKADMIDLISEIASYARQKKPGFLVMMQNAEELLANERLRRALDGVAKEDLLYGVEGEGRENTAAEVQSSLRYLRQARGDGLPVMVVEYLGDRALIEPARQRIAAEGFVAYFGPRSLNSLAQSH